MSRHGQIDGVRTGRSSSSFVGRFFLGERENGQAIILRGGSKRSSGGPCGESACCPGVGVGREKMRWKGDCRGWVLEGDSETTGV